MQWMTPEKTMYIYHYSKERYKDLRSLRCQNKLTKKELDDLDTQYTLGFNPDKYTKSISFFVEPIPYDIIGDLFNNKHNVWKNGNNLYEYLVDVDTLEKNILFMVAESPAKSKYYLSQDTDNMSDEEFDKYLKIVEKVMYKNKDIGIGRSQLETQIQRYQGMTRELFIAARKLPDSESTKEKYAANVPHLMLYPSGGIIQYKKINTIVIGKSKE